jgi:hypothetical protein
MIAPKCRICGKREHNHYCQGATPAQRVAERQRLSQPPKPAQKPPQKDEDFEPEVYEPEVYEPEVIEDEPPEADDPVEQEAPEEEDQEAPLTTQRRPGGRRWHTEDGDDGEPREVLDEVASRRPARFYAPPGQCLYCDRRRAAARVTMRAVRERGGG